jgi:hypothetical protein
MPTVVPVRSVDGQRPCPRSVVPWGMGMALGRAGAALTHRGSRHANDRVVQERKDTRPCRQVPMGVPGDGLSAIGLFPSLPSRRLLPDLPTYRLTDFSSQYRQRLIQPRHVGWVVQPARDTGGVWQGEKSKGVSRTLGGTEAPHQIGQGQSPRRWIEALRGQPPQREDDLRPHQRDLPVEMPRAERDLPGGRRAISFSAAAGRRAREALGETRQVELAMQRPERKPRSLEPALQRLSRGSCVRQWSLPGRWPGRLPHDHQPLPHMSMENRE